jgi:hypothetical protein
MISIDDVERDFRNSVCRDVRLKPEGINRYRVFTPFRHDDGDRVSLVLRREDDRWVLSDEGNTYMRLSYRFDDRALQTEGRRKIIDNAIDAANVQDVGGELRLWIDEQGYGNALYSLVQAVLRISDVTLLTREQVRSTFLEDVEKLVETLIPGPLRMRKWHEPKLDPEGRYPVDWYIRTDAVPLFLFALTSEDKVKDATITLHQFEKWNYEYRTVGIFQDQQEVSQKTLARFTDVAEKNFSALHGNEERIAHYILRMLPAGSPSSN